MSSSSSAAVAGSFIGRNSQVVHRKQVYGSGLDGYSKDIPYGITTYDREARCTPGIVYARPG